jgi:hypothetical protein
LFFGGDHGCIANDSDASSPLTATAESTKNGSTVVPTTVSKTVADKPGDTTTLTVSVLIDRTGPTGVSLVGGPAEGIRCHSNIVPAMPSCTATDTLSGFESCTVTGYSTALGRQHTLTGTATDMAGNTATETRSYSVVMRVSGFFAPVDTNGAHNTVKGGKGVPLQFEVSDGTQELRSTALVQSFHTAKISCTTGSEDANEVFATASQNELRYKFIQVHPELKDPTGSSCYRATMTTVDGQTINALFKTLKNRTLRCIASRQPRRPAPEG